MNAFFQQVYDVVARVPHGRVVSYGQIAWMLGSPRAARQVGWAMRSCPDGLPWQRVVMADGSITGGGYAEMRRGMLEAEGVAFLSDGRVDMAACQWQAP
ncbi:MAG: MGMT family protein [Clostridiales bacterium]|nr:MGMT family protein [Clostridiales bacterium]